MLERIRVAVVDDHPLFRDGVVQTLRRQETLEVIAEGDCASDAVRIAETELPDVMLLDVSMPGSGIEAARQISLSWPIIKVILLTVSEAESDVFDGLEAGVRGYVLKGVSGSDLAATIGSVHRGETIITPGLAGRLLTSMRRKNAAPVAQSLLSDLTPREDQILDCVSRGLTNKEVARTLQLSEKTVKHYMTNIMQKLQVRNRVEAAIALRRKNEGAAGLHK